MTADGILAAAIAALQQPRKQNGKSRGGENRTIITAEFVGDTRESKALNKGRQNVRNKRLVRGGPMSPGALSIVVAGITG